MIRQDSNLICTGIDDGYVWPWMVSIFSARVHSKRKLSVGLGVIAGQFSVANRELIQQFCDLLDIELLYREFEFNFVVQLDERIPIQSYIRILWMDTLDREFLWLDSDTLCLEKWDRILDYRENKDERSVISAVSDRHINRRGLINSPDNKAFQVASGSYFNDGVFLADPVRWQELGFPKIWKELAENHAEFGFTHHNQDILNFLLRDKKKLIDSSYNCIVSAPSEIGQRILHFAGGPKPWHLDSKSKRYFCAIETLKASNDASGAFSGKNWIFEFENYWRHEDSLIEELENSAELKTIALALKDSMRLPIRNNRDNIKLSILLFLGKKWL